MVNDTFLESYQRNDMMSSDSYVFSVNSEIENFLKRNNIKFKNTSNKIYIYKHSVIEPSVALYGGNHLPTIGAFSYSNSNISYGIQIGRYSSIASGLKIFGAEHFTDWISTSPRFYSSNFQTKYKNNEISDTNRKKHCINIGNDVWIGQNVTLKRKINIGDGAIVAAGAIVTKDVEPFSIVGGVPAKLIRYRFDKSTIDDILKLKWWRFNIDDLQNMDADNPKLFIEKLSNKIEKNQIQEYCPECITGESFFQFSDNNS